MNSSRIESEVRASLQERAPAQGEPVEGWKLVPIEPTDEMLRAGNATARMDCTGAWIIDPLQCWSAMLAASHASPPAAAYENIVEVLRDILKAIEETPLTCEDAYALLKDYGLWNRARSALSKYAASSVSADPQEKTVSSVSPEMSKGGNGVQGRAAMAEWLNTTRTSMWQRGCEAGRAGKPFIPPNRSGGPYDDDNRSFYNGWCFGSRQARREAADGVGGFSKRLAGRK